MKKLPLALLMGACFACGITQAKPVDQTITGEFLSSTNAPTSGQASLLEQTFQVHFPIQVITVADAMAYLLKTTGYALQDNRAYPFAFQMMHRPLANVDRYFGPLTIQEGLQTLASEHFQMIVDPINRLVAFRLKPNLLALY